MRVVVSDSSPLIHLARLGRLALLRSLYGQVIIPNAVWNEMTQAGAHRPGVVDLLAARSEDWLDIRPPVAAASPASLTPNLDAGEREAITLALQLRADLLIIDELLGRTAARSLGLAVIGTLGVLVEAKLRGFLPAVKPDLDRLRQSTWFHASDDIYNYALHLAGESL